MSLLSRTIRRESGILLWELSIFLPFLLLVGFSVLEFTAFLRMSYLLNMTSREAATLVYRECSDYREPELERTQERTSQCIQRVMLSLSDIAQRSLQQRARGVQIDIQVIRYDPAVAAIDQLSSERFLYGALQRTSLPPLETGSSGLLIQGRERVSLTEAARGQRYVVARVRVEYDSLFRFIPILGSSLSGMDYHETTIL